MNKHFPEHHKLHKICNWSNVKLRYSCMQNMQAIINRHNKTLLAKNGKTNTTSSKTCNCRVKADCPLQGNCLVKSIVYQATLESSDGPKIYYWSCFTTFKARFYNHNESFTHPKKHHATELSKAVWKAKDPGLSPKITWQITKQASAYSSEARSCSLCLEKKLAILKADLRININKCSEMFNRTNSRKANQTIENFKENSLSLYFLFPMRVAGAAPRD